MILLVCSGGGDWSTSGNLCAMKVVFNQLYIFSYFRLLTQMPVGTEEEALAAMGKLHDRGVGIVVLSSSNLGGSDHLVCLASVRKGRLL